MPWKANKIRHISLSGCCIYHIFNEPYHVMISAISTLFVPIKRMHFLEWLPSLFFELQNKIWGYLMCYDSNKTLMSFDAFIIRSYASVLLIHPFFSTYELYLSKQKDIMMLTCRFYKATYLSGFRSRPSKLAPTCMGAYLRCSLALQESVLPQSSVVAWN